MPDPSNGITFRTIQEAMPEYHLSQDLLHGVLTAMPPPPPDASPAWRKARLTRIIEEIAARVPMDPAQGHLAGQLVVVQFLADEMMERLMTPDLPLAERRLTARTTDELLRSVVRLERALERRQRRVMPFRDVGAVDGFDLAALDGLWCRGVQAAAATGPRAAAAEAPPPDAPEPEAELAPAAPAEAEEADAAAWAGRAAAEPAGGGVGVRRAGGIVEQGDGWSLEIWPPRPRAGVAPDPAAQDQPAWPTTAAEQATAERTAETGPGRSGRAHGSWHERQRNAAAANRGDTSRPPPGTAVRSADAGRQPVPRAGDGERPLPPARRGAAPGRAPRPAWRG